MAGYLELAETVIYKKGRLTIINTYNNFNAIALPSEFQFDMAIMCGPKWSVGEHKLTVKVKVNETGEETQIAEATVNIPHENFVYNAIANDVKLNMNYDVQSLTFIVYDNDEEVISRIYPVSAVLVPAQSAAEATQEGVQADEQEEHKEESQEE